MREILFKAKRSVTGEWVEGLLTVMWGQHHIINSNDENTAYPIDKDTICQFTGLTDCDGKKIWENDIIRVCDMTEEHYVVSWHETMGAFVIGNTDTNQQYPDLVGDVIQKISVVFVDGNIHDNPKSTDN